MMEHAQIQNTEGAQMVTINGQQLQVVQMNNAPHMIQGPNGQQIVVHTIPSTPQTIQVATPGGQQLQQVQVVPISSLAGAASNVQPLQLVQTADGQTFLYQPASAISAEHQIVHQPQVINLNGNLVQVAGAVQPQQLVSQPNIVMQMVNQPSSPGCGGSGSTAGAEEGEEEPLLYVNARQYKRILKRRAARARLHDLGKIPKERPKYLHESRHRHAMNRIRGDGGRFHSGSRKGMSVGEGSEQVQEELNLRLDDIKPDTVSITIIQEEESDEQPSQWKRMATQQIQST